MNRRIGLIALAVVLALAGTAAVYGYAHNADKRAVQTLQATTVLVATHQVAAGTSWQQALDDGAFSSEHLPVAATPSSAITSLDAAVPGSEVATADIAAGQIVLRPMFGQKQAVTGALAIPDGLIAVSVSLAGNADVAGFVQAGSQVAVYSTFKVTGAGASTSAPPAGQGSGASVAASTTGNGGGTAGGTDLYTTKLLLPRVGVMATSQSAPSDVNGSSSSTTASTTQTVLVTLALSQADAERLILAQQVGQLYLGLLSSTSHSAPDAGVVNRAGFTPVPIFVN